MPLTPGARIGPYEIVGPLGAGGMGEVYRARDTNLNRDVAIKVLPAALAGDPHRRARLQREAQALAALNHPQIAHVYGLEESDGSLAIVMELAEGPTLAALLDAPRPRSSGSGVHGPSRNRGLLVDEAIRIAIQVADALEAAHAAGIVHRDLKPANIKVRPDGAVKVLDFGLARMMGSDPLTSGAAADSPTVVAPAVTAHGVILGTAAYMAPEQARGETADARSDLWAFGVVLYEMLTGAPMFGGKTVSDLLASVLRDAPNWDALPPDTPPQVRRLLRRCLQKDPQLRLRNAGDARIELSEDDGTSTSSGSGLQGRTTSRRGLAASALLLCAAVGVVAFIAGQRSKAAPDRPVRKWLIPQRYQGSGFHLGGHFPAISPDGARVAYVDGAGIWIRDLDALVSRQVPVPADAGPASWPTWSPDGQSLAFAVARSFDKASLLKYPAAGGELSRISDLPPGLLWGVAWRPDGTVVANIADPNGGRLYRIPESGGEISEMPLAGGVTALQLRGYRDGTISYTRGDGKSTSLVFEGADRTVGTVSIDTLKVDLGAYWSTYSPTGHMVFDRGGGRYDAAIWAVPFDFDRRRVKGEPFRVAEFAEGVTASADGTLAYQHIGRARMELAWMDRNGRFLGSVGQPQEIIVEPSISWDGSRVAVRAIDNLQTSVWVHDLGRGTKSRLVPAARGLESSSPAWEPGDSRVSYVDFTTLLDVSIDGGAPVALAEGTDTGATLAATWSRDGRYMAFVGYRPGTRADIWVLERGTKAPRPVIETAADELEPTLAPDGEHMAYLSDETGRPELFVRTFPGGAAKLQVTSTGAAFPRWSPRGDEIFFVQGHTLMAVPVRTTPALQVRTPQRLFDLEEHAGRVKTFDTADGQRFLVVRTIEPWEQGIADVQNWYEEFRRK